MEISATDLGFTSGPTVAISRGSQWVRGRMIGRGTKVMADGDMHDASGRRALKGDEEQEYAAVQIGKGGISNCRRCSSSSSSSECSS
jgi:hypothetical protein